MAKAKKLPSGQWRTLVYDYTDNTGKRHYESFTAGSKKESEYLAAEFALTKKDKKKNVLLNMTLGKAMEEYCVTKNNVLSPSTIRGYEQLRRTAYGDIETIKLKDIANNDIQSWANTYSLGHSPKTVQNAHGFLSAVIYTYNPDFHINTSLPSKIRHDNYVPTDADVQKLIRYYSETDKDMLIASCLAAFGTLRRSEICGLSSSHIEDNIIHIRQSCIKDKDNKFIIKSFPKNYTSARDIVMPQFVIDLLPSSGPVVAINPNQITLRHIKTLSALDINKFRFHDLRHYAASIMHALGIPDQYIMERGGWSSDKTLKEIYRGTMDDYNAKFQNIAFEHFQNMQHEMQHEKINPQ